MLFNSPLSDEKADRLVNLLDLRPGNRALDVGCGTGEFLLRIVAHHGVHGIGIDRDSRCIAAAQEAAASRALSARCEFHAIDANEFAAGPGAFHLGMCIGSTHAFGTGDAAYPNTIKRLIELVQPGGYVLIGEAYWKQDPAPDYLNLLGDPVGIYRDHAGNISFAESHGLEPLYAAVSNDDEWDHFEWSHQRKVAREAANHPDDPTFAARLAHSRQWRDGYLR